MLRAEAKFSFKNLEPIAYLKNFNRMIDYDERRSLQTSSRKQLKTVSLNKFPLPSFYQSMEGIFQSVSRKKVDPVKSQRNLKQLEEERFMQKHNSFMRKVLTKFIEHNEQRQSLFQQDKQFQRKSEDFKKHGRTSSQPKIQRKKEKIVIDLNPEINPSEPALATKGSVCTVEQAPKEVVSSVLPHLKPRKKKEKFKIRKDSNVEEILLSRKLNSPAQQVQSFTNKLSNDEKLDFKESIVSLQKQQTGIQQSFSSKVERQIAEFDKKMDIQVHAIKYYNFWRQPLTSDEPQCKKEKKIQEKNDEYAQSKVALHRYRTR